jgi:hypothetical protein
MKNKTTFFLFMLAFFSISLLSGTSLYASTHKGGSATITGITLTCAGTENVVYQTEENMVDYFWEVSDGGIITEGQGKPTVTVEWKSAGNQIIFVRYFDPAGITLVTGQLSVEVERVPVPTITGIDQACLSDVTTKFSTEEGNENYTWNISDGGVIIAGEGTNEIEVLWRASGNQVVSVNYSNGAECSAPLPTEKNVEISTLPDSKLYVKGEQQVCAGSTLVNYYVEPQPDIVDYYWSLPEGVLIVDGIGTNSIMVDFANYIHSGDITVYGANLCGSGPVSQPYYVSVKPIPENAGLITGTTDVCTGQTQVTYSVPMIPSAMAYEWIVPQGATITSGGNTNSIEVTFADNSTSGNVNVYGVNSCGEGQPSGMLVNVNETPQAPVIVLDGDCLRSNATSGNQWYMDGAAIPGANRQQYYVTMPGTYWATASNGGCISEASNTIDVVLTKVNELNEATAKVYPNPTDGKFTISFNGSFNSAVKIQVYNNLGVVVYEREDVKASSMFVDLGAVASGTYGLVISGDNYHFVKNIIVR